MIVLLALLALLFTTIVLATETGWESVLSGSRNELVFGGRNRAYGAYPMRREHPRTMVVAFMIAMGLVGGTLTLPRLFFSAVAVPPAIPILPIDDEVMKVVDVALKPALDAIPDRPAPKPTKGSMDRGPVIAVDSLPVVRTDSSSTASSPDPGAGKGPGVDPGPGTGSGNDGPKGTGSDMGVKDGWELEVMPEYPGGTKALYAYLGKEMHYPDIDVDARREGRVTVGFIIRSDGSVTDVRILQGISPTLDAEALRVVRRMIKWKPGRFNDREVDVRYALPIMFKLKD